MKEIVRLLDGEESKIQLHCLQAVHFVFILFFLINFFFIPTASNIPRWSPIQVLTRPDPA